MSIDLFHDLAAAGADLGADAGVVQFIDRAGQPQIFTRDDLAARYGGNAVKTAKWATIVLPTAGGETAVEVWEYATPTTDDIVAQTARSAAFGIAPKDAGNVTIPPELAGAGLTDAAFGDPVNYLWPAHDKAAADASLARLRQEGKGLYTDAEYAAVEARILAGPAPAAPAATIDKGAAPPATKEKPAMVDCTNPDCTLKVPEGADECPDGHKQTSADDDDDKKHKDAAPAGGDAALTATGSPQLVELAGITYEVKAGPDGQPTLVAYTPDTRKALADTFADRVDEALDNAVYGVLAGITDAFLATITGGYDWWSGEFGADPDAWEQGDFEAATAALALALNQAYAGLKQNETISDDLEKAARWHSANKLAVISETVKSLTATTKEGKVLSAASLTLIKTAHDALTDLAGADKLCAAGDVQAGDPGDPENTGAGTGAPTAPAAGTTTALADNFPAGTTGKHASTPPPATAAAATRQNAWQTHRAAAAATQNALDEQRAEATKAAQARAAAIRAGDLGDSEPADGDPAEPVTVMDRFKGIYGPDTDGGIAAATALAGQAGIHEHVWTMSDVSD